LALRHGADTLGAMLFFLLAGSLFRVENRETALFLPPTAMRLILRSNRVWEGLGHRLIPQFAGVTITEAVKDVYSAIPTKPNASRRFVLAEVP